MVDRSKEPSIQIRELRSGDEEPTLAIFQSAIRETAAADYTPAQLEAWADPKRWTPEAWCESIETRSTFVATLGEEVVGFSDLDESGYIDMVFVHPSHQRRGIGTALICEARERANALGASALSADVSITARPFFEAQGFSVAQQQHATRNGISMTNFRMKKELE